MKKIVSTDKMMMSDICMMSCFACLKSLGQSAKLNRLLYRGVKAPLFLYRSIGVSLCAKYMAFRATEEEN